MADDIEEYPEVGVRLRKQHGGALHEKVQRAEDAADEEDVKPVKVDVDPNDPSDIIRDGIVKSLLKLKDGDRPLAWTLNTLSELMQYSTGNEKWFDSVVEWMHKTLKKDDGKPMFSSVVEARKFLEDLKNKKKLSKQIKWRVPSVFERLATEPGNKQINPMLIRGLTNSSSNNFNRTYA